jgi:hypothetical protein
MEINMSGNTRGKLKEHLEGIHRNFDWILHHVGESLTLIEAQLKLTEEYIAVQGDEKAEEQVLEKNTMYAGMKSIGLGVQTMDEILNGIYAHV